MSIDLIASPVFLAAAAPAGPNIIMQLLPLLFLFVVFYFLLIRPQQKARKQHEEMVTKLQRGDVVTTSGGIVGKIARVSDDMVTVEIAENVKVKVVKRTISEVRSRTEPVNDTDTEDRPAS
jgi:preprotein translocase subunit YajC